MGSSLLPQALDGSAFSSRNAYRSARIPKYAIALLKALQFSDPDTRLLQSLNEAEWQKLLHFCDSRQLTLILGHFCRSSLPEWVRTRIDRNYRDNAERFARLNASLFEISDSLDARDIEFVMLKGSAHSPHFTPSPLLRPQGDIDLWCLPESVFQARDALLDLEYFPFCKAQGRHLPPMARRTNWQWRGNYFAPDLPIPVDLHYILWDESAEHIPGPAEHEFWETRCQMHIDGHPIPVLCVADTLAFAALHLLMHLLHGDLPLQRAWEIAHFMDSRACEDDFWTSWSQLHPAPLRKLELIVFALAADWFGCTYPALLAEETKNLPDDVKVWIQRYASSPLEGLFRPNKDELWLNLSLLDSSRDKIGTFVRRVFPIHLPPTQDSGSVGDAHEQPETLGLDRRFLISRVIHHTRTMIPTFAGGVKWWWIRQRLGRDFLVFQLTSALSDFGEYIFYLLFNLYLLERGYNEKFLGQVSSAMTAGTVIGAIPAVALTRRGGLRVALLVALIGAPVTAALRAVVVNETTLLVCAFINGLFMSLWAISFAPAVSALTNERNRTFAFSLVSSIGIGLGVLAGFVGGRLPGFLMRVTPSLHSLEAKRTALLCGCGMAFLGVIPACWLKFKDPPKTEKRAYPRGRFILGFLVALFVWSVATGAFNPFFNAYLSRYHHMSVEHIGLVFSYSQIAQVFVILLAPAVLRWLGQVRGIAFMQVATAAMLGLLGLGFAGTTGAALLYVGYMSFQYMSEPGLFSMLMSRVKPAERSGASALNFLVLSLAGSFSALVSGAAISRFGYSAVLGTAAGLAIIAAALFWILIGEET